MSKKTIAIVAGSAAAVLVLAAAVFIWVIIPRTIIQPAGGQSIGNASVPVNDGPAVRATIQAQSGNTPATRARGQTQTESNMPASTGAQAEAGGSKNPNDRPYANVYFQGEEANPFIDADEDNLSTFALDGDTASFDIASHWAAGTAAIDPESVRVEEWVNAVPQQYDRTGQDGVVLMLDGARTIFPERYTEDAAPHYRTLRVGVSMPQPSVTRPPVSVVFVIDASGSMGQAMWATPDEPDPISGLRGAKELAKATIATMREGDEAAVVVYGESAHIVADWAPAGNLDDLKRHLEDIRIGGSTYLQAGIQRAYEMTLTREPGRDVKIVVISDGVANQGITGAPRLMEQITTESKSKTVVHTIGVGLQSTYNDVMLEGLANLGNGVYRYVNDTGEIDQFAQSDAHLLLEPTIRDARIQVEFNPGTVRKYRLMGYENRAVADSDFRIDTLNFGEPAASRDVTALYEVRMQEDTDPAAVLATATLRYRPHDQEQHTEISASITAGGVDTPPENAAPALRRAAAVGLYAETAKATRWAACTEPARIKEVLGEVSLDGKFDTQMAQLIQNYPNLQPPPCQR